MAKIIQILSVFILITQFKYAHKSFVSYVIISYSGTEVHHNYHDVVLIAIFLVINGRTDFSLLLFSYHYVAHIPVLLSLFCILYCRDQSHWFPECPAGIFPSRMLSVLTLLCCKASFLHLPFVLLLPSLAILASPSLSCMSIVSVTCCFLSTQTSIYLEKRWFDFAVSFLGCVSSLDIERSLPTWLHVVFFQFGFSSFGCSYKAS